MAWRPRVTMTFESCRVHQFLPSQFPSSPATQTKTQDLPDSSENTDEFALAKLHLQLTPTSDVLSLSTAWERRNFANDFHEVRIFKSFSV